MSVNPSGAMVAIETQWCERVATRQASGVKLRRSLSRDEEGRTMSRDDLQFNVPPKVFGEVAAVATRATSTLRILIRDDTTGDVIVFIPTMLEATKSAVAGPNWRGHPIGRHWRGQRIGR
jgi:hypothetical protein